MRVHVFVCVRVLAAWENEDPSAALSSSSFSLLSFLFPPLSPSVSVCLLNYLDLPSLPPSLHPSRLSPSLDIYLPRSLPPSLVPSL